MKVSHSCRGAYMYLSNHFGPHYGFLGKELSDMHIWSRKTLKRARIPFLKRGSWSPLSQWLIWSELHMILQIFNMNYIGRWLQSLFKVFICRYYQTKHSWLKQTAVFGFVLTRHLAGCQTDFIICQAAMRRIWCRRPK